MKSSRKLGLLSTKTINGSREEARETITERMSYILKPCVGRNKEIFVELSHRFEDMPEPSSVFYNRSCATPRKIVVLLPDITEAGCPLMCVHTSSGWTLLMKYSNRSLRADGFRTLGRSLMFHSRSIRVFQVPSDMLDAPLGRLPRQWLVGTVCLKDGTFHKYVKRPMLDMSKGVDLTR